MTNNIALNENLVVMLAILTTVRHRKTQQKGGESKPGATLFCANTLPSLQETPRPSTQRTEKVLYNGISSILESLWAWQVAPKYG